MLEFKIIPQTPSKIIPKIHEFEIKTFQIYQFKIQIQIQVSKHNLRISLTKFYHYYEKKKTFSFYVWEYVTIFLLKFKIK